MDFLPIFLGYVIVFGICVLLVLFSRASPFLSSVIDKIKQLSLQIVNTIVPQFLIKLITKCVHYVFNTRNHVMQIVFGLLVLGGNIILMLDILPLLYIFEPDENHILLPLILLFSNLAAFHLSCVTDPGRITSSNAAMLASLYKADGLLFKEKVECRTCKLIKPPRSKHCNICNRCIHRFDHHCIWTNNCVGAGNLRFFIPFLLSLMVMVVNGMVMGCRALMLLVHHFKMMDSSYVDSHTGDVLPVTIPVLIQHLFMRHPRSVFLVSSLMMLMILLGLFTFYHLFLAYSNQTTNERYKIAALPLGKSVSTNKNSHSEHSSEEQTKPKPPLLISGQTRMNENNKDKNGNCSISQKQSREWGKSQKQSREGGKSQKQSKEAGTGSSNNFENVKDSPIHKDQRIHDENEKLIRKRRDVSSFYDQGLIRNLKEVFFPWSEFNKLKKRAAESNMVSRSRNMSVQKAKRR